ncbi:hypothetical protein KIH27_20120 [Mycobacterium sp. M1]|uniref:DUF2339 domain-containing protein n=1 Tax=Mycolicibacter acidiphilus TaxID=2835306 RepID=A0ABS5RSF5_9MYCO|nr:hypothetical protein [Mycolicibacter acidiphilus]MBS9535894.1 hypothetical protein [Mycolicibacter acidiphilus]
MGTSVVNGDLSANDPRQWANPGAGHPAPPMPPGVQPPPAIFRGTETPPWLDPGRPAPVRPDQPASAAGNFQHPAGQAPPGNAPMGQADPYWSGSTPYPMAPPAQPALGGITKAVVVVLAFVTFALLRYAFPSVPKALLMGFAAVVLGVGYGLYRKAVGGPQGTEPPA